MVKPRSSSRICRRSGSTGLRSHGRAWRPASFRSRGVTTLQEVRLTGLVDQFDGQPRLASSRYFADVSHMSDKVPWVTPSRPYPALVVKLRENIRDGAAVVFQPRTLGIPPEDFFICLRGWDRPLAPCSESAEGRLPRPARSDRGWWRRSADNQRVPETCRRYGA